MRLSWPDQAVVPTSHYPPGGIMRELLRTDPSCPTPEPEELIVTRHSTIIAQPQVRRGYWKHRKPEMEVCYKCQRARYIGQKKWRTNLNTAFMPIRSVLCEYC